jgi:hypothetical protein
MHGFVYLLLVLSIGLIVARKVIEKKMEELK